jgi:hypothetical protein
MRDVLLLDRSDLGIKLTSERVREQRTDIHVVVMRLLLRCDECQRVELGQWRCSGSVERSPHIVFRRAMFDHCRPAGQYVGIALQDVVGVLAFQAIEQSREAIHVVLAAPRAQQG